MNCEPLRRTVVVRNSQGIHLRPAASFAELAGKFQCTISVQRAGEEKINGKSSMSLLTLAATQGTELILEASGPDAEQALDALVKFFDELVVIEP